MSEANIYRHFGRVELVAMDLQVLFVIVMAICTISSFVGIRKALKVEPAAALGG